MEWEYEDALKASEPVEGYTTFAWMLVCSDTIAVVAAVLARLESLDLEGALGCDRCQLTAEEACAPGLCTTLLAAHGKGIDVFARQ